MTYVIIIMIGWLRAVSRSWPPVCWILKWRNYNSTFISQKWLVTSTRWWKAILSLRAGTSRTYVGYTHYVMGKPRSYIRLQSTCLGANITHSLECATRSDEYALDNYGEVTRVCPRIKKITYCNCYIFLIFIK